MMYLRISVTFYPETEKELFYLFQENVNYNTSELSKRYGCSTQAMAHRILYHITKLNDNGVHALQDVTTKQWHVDEIGVRILDSLFKPKKEFHKNTSNVVSLHTDMETIHKDMTSMQEQINKMQDTISKLFEQNQQLKQKEKSLDKELETYRNKEAAATISHDIIYRTGMNWCKQVNDFIRDYAQVNGLQNYEAYRYLYDLFCQETGYNVYQLRDDYMRSHKRQMNGKKNIPIVRVIHHNEPIAIAFTNFINSLVSKEN